LVSGRFKLKHHRYDGLDEVLEAYGVSDEDIKMIRNATIITEITIDEDEFSISTSDSASPEQANTVTFTPGTAVNITNPITGEQLEFLATILGPSTIQTRSEGLDSGTVELKTWTFSPGGASVTTELHKDNKLFPITANQVMVRVGEDDKARPLVLGWI